ncbi:MAG: endolytic transglycosylase MltG [Candidatus Dojkabacteria bacterium]|nr:endolytic transglycosylase MltG [Candidatus Dojkabacteria bacterium]MDQ7020379.1 endolytic transglycosylase MltG [Candidatus Dojkabacteria bacterium]
MRKTILTLLLIIFVGMIGVFIYGRNWYNNAIYENKVEKDTLFIVNQGEGFADVLENLKNEGLVDNVLAIKVYTKLNNVNTHVKFGEHLIKAGSDVPVIIETLKLDTYREGVLVQIDEDLRSDLMAKQIKDELGENSAFSITEYSAVVNSPRSYNFSPEATEFLDNYLPSDVNSLEGYLYPDTYELDQNVTAIEVIDRQLVRLGNLITGLEPLNLDQDNITNLYEALTLASIIQKEAAGWDDRGDISGIFHNRLADDYLLQSDATVNYVTGKNEAGASLADLEIDNPYNTYKYTGLPPGPINSPSFESIKAAFYPNETENYYFFHVEDDKQTFYSETFEEHQAKVAQYRGFN